MASPDFAGALGVAGAQRIHEFDVFAQRLIPSSRR
jgi:hypothetical protein